MVDEDRRLVAPGISTADHLLSTVLHLRTIFMPSNPHSRPRLLGVASTALAVWLLALWVGWWGKSLRHDRLAYGRMTWTPILPFLAGDFKVHIDHTARILVRGGDIYSA